MPSNTTLPVSIKKRCHRRRGIVTAFLSLQLVKALLAFLFLSVGVVRGRKEVKDA